jgi:hypothetical protein
MGECHHNLMESSSGGGGHGQVLIYSTTPDMFQCENAALALQLGTAALAPGLNVRFGGRNVRFWREVGDQPSI